MKPCLDIVIVNRNSGHQLRECLCSISAADKTGIELRRVCVVDDASTDDSLRDITLMSLPLKILRNDVHTGYGASCNRGAAESDAKYILFLNTDTVLHLSSLIVPIRYLEQPEHSTVGIVGVQLLDDRGAVSRSCSRFPTFRRMLANVIGLDHVLPSVFPRHQMAEWDHLETRKVDQVIGAFMLVRRTVFEQLGGYDERFFVYMEDLDFSLRMRELGYRSVYLSTATAFHGGGGTSRRVKAESLFFLLRSRFQYAVKHFGKPRGLVILLATLGVEPVSRLVLAVWRRSWDDAWATLKAYTRIWKELPRLGHLASKTTNCLIVPSGSRTAATAGLPNHDPSAARMAIHPEEGKP